MSEVDETSSSGNNVGISSHLRISKEVQFTDMDVESNADGIVPMHAIVTGNEKKCTEEEQSDCEDTNRKKHTLNPGTKNDTDDIELREVLCTGVFDVESKGDGTPENHVLHIGNEEKAIAFKEEQLKLGMYTVDPGKDGDNDENEGSCYTNVVERIEHGVATFFSKHNRRIKMGIKIVLLSVYVVYFIYCMQYRFGDEGSKVLLFITCCLFWKLLFVVLDKRGIIIGPPKSFHEFAATKRGQRYRRISRFALYLIALAALGAYLGLEVFAKNIRNIHSFVGMLILIIMCFLMSSKPSKVNWHPVFWSFVIQFVVATLTLRTAFGYNTFKWLGDLVRDLFAFSDAGSRLVIDENFDKMGLALSATGSIIFTNALVFLLNHWGVIEFIVLKLGGFLSFCLETGPVESVVAASNIFLGLSEAAILVRPYIKTVTTSEIHTIITCGFASITGSVMSLFIRVGAPPNHLLTAAIISAPAALAISKLMYPETDYVTIQSQSNIRLRDKERNKDTTSVNAFSDGAAMALTIAAAVWSNLVAFVSMLSLLDFVVGWLGARAGIDGLSFDMICSYVLFPLAFVMGVDEGDCRNVGSLIGVKLFANPVIAYTNLGELIKNRELYHGYISSPNNTWYWDGDNIILEAMNATLVKGIMSERSETIATYAMCGLSSVTSIGICLGSFIPIAPSRKPDIVKTVARAFIAGNMASFATGAIAGVMFSSGD